MHVITLCSLCGKDFMYHQTDFHLFREPKSNFEIKRDYPVQDAIWPSRRWNLEITDFCDLSGSYAICQDCDEIEKIAMFIEEKAGYRGWDIAECMADYKFGEEKTLKAMEWLSKNDTNSDM